MAASSATVKVNYEESIRLLEDAKEKLLAECRDRVAQIDATVAALRELQMKGSHGGKPEGGALAVRPGQYLGMKAVGALQAYLLERGGGPVSRTQAAKDLRLAGAEPKWTEKRYKQNLLITIHNHADKFRYDEHTDTVTMINKRSGVA